MQQLQVWASYIYKAALPYYTVHCKKYNVCSCSYKATAVLCSETTMHT